VSYAAKYLDALKEAIEAINTADVDEVIEILAKAKEEGRKVFVVGNGGSASSSSHFVTDMAKGAYNEKMENFQIISLCDNSAMITALGNDFSFDDVFVGQLRACFKPGDVLLAISASGNSPNVIKAVQYANQNGGSSIGLCGFKGGKLNEIATKSVYIPIEHYGLVEDGHMIVCHIIAYYFMEKAGNMKPL
jgi:D-sedoheptulose 7-phosphate isomerase